MQKVQENAAAAADVGQPASFPAWLAPTQARFIPVSRDDADFCDVLYRKLAGRQIRADVDDRDESVGKRVRLGEQEWVPYQIVVGEAGRNSGPLSVRCRQDGTRQTMRLEALIELVRKETDGMPFKPLPLPRRLRQRPVFYG